MKPPDKKVGQVRVSCPALFVGRYMNLLKENVRTLYFNYLAAAFGSAMITLVYSLVDMQWSDSPKAPMGQPHWQLLHRFGILFIVLVC